MKESQLGPLRIQILTLVCIINFPNLRHGYRSKCFQLQDWNTSLQVKVPVELSEGRKTLFPTTHTEQCLPLRVLLTARG